MQYFYINKDSVLPSLRCAIIDDGKTQFLKKYEFNNAVQDADVTFSMRDVDTDKLKVSKAPAEILLASEGSCGEGYILQYNWKKRDVNEAGQYKAWFEITFKGELVESGVDYPSGNLIVPITEDLFVCVK